MVGSLTGAVSSQSVMEEHKGVLGTVGNRADSVWVDGSLTARPTSRAGTKVGPSDPVVKMGSDLVEAAGFGRSLHKADFAMFRVVAGAEGFEFSDH